MREKAFLESEGRVGSASNPTNAPLDIASYGNADRSKALVNIRLVLRPNGGDAACCICVDFLEAFLHAR